MSLRQFAQRPGDVLVAGRADVLHPGRLRRAALEAGGGPPTRRANQADTEYLARELAAVRLAVGDVATGDYLRCELDELRTVIKELRPSTDLSRMKNNKSDLADRRAKRVT